MRVRYVLSYLATSLFVLSCAAAHSTTRPAPGTLTAGTTLRDPAGRFVLVVPRNGLEQTAGTRGIALTSPNGAYGFSVLAYARPAGAKSDDDALQMFLKERLQAVSRNGRYTYRILRQQRFTRQQHRGLRVQFLLVPREGWARRAYVCHVIAAGDQMFWLHGSMMRTAQFGDINRRFVADVERFCSHVRFADEITDRPQTPQPRGRLPTKRERLTPAKPPSESLTP